MSNEQVLEYIKRLTNKLIDDLLEEEGSFILETTDVEAYKDKIKDIVSITVTNEIRERVDETKEEIKKKYGIPNPDVMIVPSLNSVLNYININEVIKNLTDDGDDENDEFVLGIPRDLYEEMYIELRDSILIIKRAIIPEMKDNTVAIKEVVSKFLSEDETNVEDIILPDSNIYELISDRGLLEPTGASNNVKDVRLLGGQLPSELLDYDKVIDDLPMSDLKVLFKEYKDNFIGWEHIDEEVNEILDNGILATISLNVKNKIKPFELPVTLTLLLMFKSLIANSDKYGLDSTTRFGIRVVYDYIVNKYISNYKVYELKLREKQPILGIEGKDHPIVYLIGSLLEEYDLDLLNAYALKKFEELKAKGVNNVILTLVDKIDNIVNDKDKYLNYVVAYNKLKVAKKMSEITLALANAYGLQLSNNSPKLVEYLTKVDETSGYNVKNEIFKTSKEYIKSKSVDPTEVSKNVINIVRILSVGTDLNDYLSSIMKYDKLLDDVKDVNLLSILGATGVVVSDIVDDLVFMKNDSKR